MGVLGITKSSRGVVNHAANSGLPVKPASVDPLQALRQVLELQRESDPALDVEERLRCAVADPDQEIVDSLGAVSVICILYGGYSPDSLIPAKLLAHKNLTTLGGLTEVIRELNRTRAEA
jgi:anion-transporting  ArsA/GET3 family ATPase